MNEENVGAENVLGVPPTPNEAPPVFIFVGHSGSGKTTLVEKLIPELTSRGLQVATIKHAHHKVVLDKEGKDSWRYKHAGATMSMLVTSGELKLVADAIVQREPAQLARRFLRCKPWVRFGRSTGAVYLVHAEVYTASMDRNS